MTMIGSGSDAGSLARERRLRSHIVSVELMRELVTRASTQKSSSMSGISRPAVRGGLVLYLDFDGVLHPEDVRMDRKRRPYVASPPGHELFEHAALLHKLLAPHPDIRIVLSTSWVHVYGSVSKVAKRLPPALGARVIGATYHSEMDRAPRLCRSCRFEVSPTASLSLIHEGLWLAYTTADCPPVGLRAGPRPVSAGLALFTVSLVLAGATALRFYLVSWLGERVTADLRKAVYEHMLGMSPQFFETTQSGEVLSRLTTDTTLIQTVVGTSLSMGLRNFFLLTGGLAMLAVTSPVLSGYIMATLVVVVAPIVIFGRRVRRLSRASQDKVANVSALAGEVLNAMPTVQSFTQEPREARRFAGMVAPARPGWRARPSRLRGRGWPRACRRPALCRYIPAARSAAQAGQT
jgi:ABC transporter transmembrane region/HAD domain in Swiss Army Knife RNA repair proteins